MFTEKMEAQIRDCINLLVDKGFLAEGRERMDFEDQLRNQLAQVRKEQRSFDILRVTSGTQLPDKVTLSYSSIFNVDHVDDKLQMISIRGMLQKTVPFDLVINPKKPLQPVRQLEESLLVPAAKSPRRMVKQAPKTGGKKMK